MTLICDSREKQNAHILSYFDSNNVPYIIEAMKTADYQIQGNDTVLIDRKQNLDELARNLTNRSDKSRFWKEVRRAKENGSKLIILCEHSNRIKSIKDVAKWNSKYSPVSGRMLMDKIYQCHISYGVEFLFCDKRNTGKEIIRLLSL